MISKQGINKLFNLEVNPDATGVIIYSEQVTPRLQYVCRFIFEYVIGVKHVITSDKREFSSSSFFRINYSEAIIENAFQIIPAGLIFQNQVTEEKPTVSKRNNIIYIFESKNNANLDFDLFSAVFFQIARCEEWQSFSKDQHQRFELDQSFLFKYKVHLKPVTDIWIAEFKQSLAKFYPTIIFPLKQSQVIATIDVDNLFAYSHKGFLRTAGGAMKDILRFDFKNFRERIGVLSGKKDPFDVYESFSKFCYGHNIPLLWFFLFRSGTKHDRTVDPSSSSFDKVLEKIKTNHAIAGLHPSYESSVNEQQLSSEIKTFSEKLKEKVQISRQHYLRFDIRSTPQMLLKNGIHTDFTMGFASGVGFRAGTSFPFNYYDFSKEMESELLFVPFCAMDGAYTVYETVTAEKAYESLSQLRDEVRKVNGPFITVFHERTFSDHLYPAFGGMFKKLLSTPHPEK
ncbi:MAG: hypothetical protein K0S32_480 [Bacteroidetes bacterium]|jgi:hypothetical protein|nr:hypothetical protein [Bacteroidota bacterium]